MKKLILLLFLIVALPALAQSEDYRIYESGKPVVAKYFTKTRSDGSIAVYDVRQVVIPKYIVRPNADGSKSVFKAGEPVLPLYRVEKKRY